ncbi:hypothetical protein L1049_001603 [Liquidambar formosana]|uniref:1,3-beta-glucan synthase component FKS1-like domain-containing protein n=1 Tax=Liquidambar formosana TaxID=63359 RepID=A0AAP0QZL9_LIQFO
MNKFFKNYRSWCGYLHCKSIVDQFPAGADRQQLKLLYIGLYLLIWGEASNVRFMPECICYIFHNMANEVYEILFANVDLVTGGTYLTPHGKESFLRDVITPIYRVLREEARISKGGKASHSTWRNYDDLNEYFWSDKCLKLRSPMNPNADFWNLNADFFVLSDEIRSASKRSKKVAAGNWKPKTNFVEVRTFWHLFRSFDRMWIFFILSFQVMVIIAWSPSRSLTAFFEEDVFKGILSIFITSAFLNFLQASLDIILSWNAWRSLKLSQILRYLLKFAVAAVWIVVLPIGYFSSVQNPTGLLKFFSSWAGDWWIQSSYNYCVAIFLIPNILDTLLFFLPPLRRSMEHSNRQIVIFLMWWAQPKLYVGRGMHEDMFSLLKYTMFWIVLLISKLAFSYYVEILPLVGPTKLIMRMRIVTYEWHEFFPNVSYNIGAVIAIWAPIVLVYFMDAQLWYAIFSTLFGGIHGAYIHLGEIRKLGKLQSSFDLIPSAFIDHLVPLSELDRITNFTGGSEKQRIAQKFFKVWNEFIRSMRMEDFISNRERELLLAPDSPSEVSVIQWPLFLLASKISIALDMAKDFKRKGDAKLFKKIKNDCYMHSALIEFYETLRDILCDLLKDEGDKRIIGKICYEVEDSIKRFKFLHKFQMGNMPLLSVKLEEFLKILVDGKKNDSEIIEVFQDVMLILTQDVLSNKILDNQIDMAKQKFKNINIQVTQNESWRERVVRLHLILTVKESTINVPMNLEARRRITFFTNSLFMRMPKAPMVQKMLSFGSVPSCKGVIQLYSISWINYP